jgi:hypothetical protein
VLLGDEVVADHPRNFQRERIIYDPWHYLPVLMSADSWRSRPPKRDDVARRNGMMPPAITR